jgi:homoserine kinase
MESIKVFASATVANVACGFDVLGFAVSEPGDEIIIKKNNSGTLKIISIEGDEGKLPLEIEKNTASVVIQKILEHLKANQGFDIYLRKKMPLGSGLGSSAASSVAGAFAINEILGRPLTGMELLPFAMEGERVACGSAHADNVAPALLGGFILIRSYDPLDVVKLPSLPDLYATVIHPQIEIRTKDARGILRKEITLKDAVRQWGNVGGFVAGLYSGDYGLLGRSMVDHIVEPIRSVLLPGYDEAKQAALEAGALGFGISGSGPSLFTLSKGKEIAIKAAGEMSRVYDDLKIESEVYISEINQNGPQVLN